MIERHGGGGYTPDNAAPEESVPSGDRRHQKSGVCPSRETAMSHAQNRQLPMQLGRWLNADPSGLQAAKLDDPQTWNMYAYVRNDPMTLTDPTGLRGTVAQGGPLYCDAGEWDGCTQPSLAQSFAWNVVDQERDAEAVAWEMAQNTPQYDPKKSGPEDPTNPGHPLSQNSVVKKASDEAFMKTTNGQARSGLAEAGFAIDYKDGKISIVNKVDSVNSDKKANELQITTDENTKAILHTHGNSALPTPSPGDLKSPVPNFVRSQRDLYVTVPGTTTYIQLQ